ncbi:MAG: threonine--tRNA ligase [Actinomycetota bacterium]
MGAEEAHREVCYRLADGTLVDLPGAKLPGATVVRENEPAGREVMRHSAAHVMAQAVLALWPGAKYAIGPPIEDGFYYDFDIGRPFTPEDLERIDARMREIVAEDQAFVREDVTIAQAARIFLGQPYKLEILEGIGADSFDQGVGEETVSLYRNDGSFVDLCRGPHLPSTGRIKAFKLLRTSGAYWRGDERRPMLQRIYGTAWESPEVLQTYIHRLEEAQRRDHRRLGVDLDLFSFPPELGGGLAVWHPKGGIMRRILEEYSRRAHERAGYEFVYSPHVARSVLWETSGHLDFYAEHMYPAMTLEDSSYYVKPMNCPFHVLIYRSRTRSYRDLPLRLFEFGSVYRYERSGVLQGLLRVRGMTQDDAHIFATEEQVVPELRSLLGFMIRLLKEFGFEHFQAKLSTRDPRKSVGSDTGWEVATEALRQALLHERIEFSVAEGEAAFYGPKIDVEIRDALGRSWQASTLQVDFNLPERFDLAYVRSDNSRSRPFMIHRALFGSLERFFALLVEHYAGAFPTWLAPVQVQVIPIAGRHRDHAQEVAMELGGAGVRVEVDASDETLANRIRKAQVAKIPYTLVVGDREVQARNVSVRPRRGEERRGMSLPDFVASITEEIAGRGSP